MLGGKGHGVRKAVRAVNLNRKFHPSTGENLLFGKPGTPADRACKGGAGRVIRSEFKLPDDTPNT